MDIMDVMDTMDFPFDGRMDRFKDVTCCKRPFVSIKTCPFMSMTSIASIVSLSINKTVSKKDFLTTNHTNRHENFSMGCCSGGWDCMRFKKWRNRPGCEGAFVFSC